MSMAIVKITPSPLRTLVVLALILSHARADPDPLQDYCVADTSNRHSFWVNGAPCIDPHSASVSHFTTSALSKPGNPKANPFGSNVTLTNIANLPGLNTMGLTMARVDIAGNGLVPPHSHPRASEVTICLEGVIGVGFVDTSNRLFTQILRPGESFVFPKGLIHYLYNFDWTNSALAISGFNSQNPGAQIASLAAFTAKPGIPDKVLATAFQITGQDVARIRKNLGG
ncbi:germin-like protein subfamily 1 member 1 [Rhodamnia argentea]|uniref:Germin-like protein n=1 Tax=Rhodamnia argentea TaxID=178133 RepID=A0A8B8R2U2_9MYRT|nr:germin-like protein subfamily 1 member 1 [Rhodamnia argentea]